MFLITHAFREIRGLGIRGSGFGIDMRHMPRAIPLVLLTLLMSSGLQSQTRGGTPAEAPPDSRFHAVSYVETMAAAKDKAPAVLRKYRDDSQKQDGCLRVEVFEQVGRPGHWAIVETWNDAKAFDARGANVQQELLDALRPIRVSDYDQRAYKTLTVDTAAAGAQARRGSGQAVSVVAHVDVTPNPQVPVLLRRLAEASRREDGNVRFDVFQHTMRANHFTVVETWQSQRALDAHVAATHTKQYRDELQPLTGSPLDERVYTTLP